ncbi:unnamed protein product [Brassica rapa subsp. narinosa]
MVVPMREYEDSEARSERGLGDPASEICTSDEVCIFSGPHTLLIYSFLDLGILIPFRRKSRAASSKSRAIEFDVLNIGAGQAGPPAAIRSKQLCQEKNTDLSICVVEKGAKVGQLSNSLFIYLLLCNIH